LISKKVPSENRKITWGGDKFVRTVHNSIFT